MGSAEKRAAVASFPIREAIDLSTPRLCPFRSFPKRPSRLMLSS